jgi:Ca-activated chloride channel homolog
MIWFNSTYLWFLLIIPILAGGIYLIKRRDENLRNRFFDQRLINQLRRGFWKTGEKVRLAFLLVAFLFFVIGLAGPKIGTEVRDIEQRGADLLFVLDLSRSMNAEDIRPSRLEKAKFEIQRVIERSTGDRIGLLVFTGEAFVQSPMTQDHSALRMFLDIAETHQMPSSTTNFRAAFEKAKEMFDGLEDRRDAARVILMISDGEDHGESYSNSLQALTRDGIFIFTVGIGTENGGRIPLYERGSNELIGYHRDRDGREVVTRLEPQTLREIAAAGNGNYFEISSSTAGIDPFLSRLDDIQRGEFTTEEYADYVNRYQILVLAGLVLLIAGLVVPEYRRDESTES